MVPHTPENQLYVFAFILWIRYVSFSGCFMPLLMPYNIANICRILMILHFYWFENELRTKDVIPPSFSKCYLRCQCDFSCQPDWSLSTELLSHSETQMIVYDLLIYVFKKCFILFVCRAFEEQWNKQWYLSQVYFLINQEWRRKQTETEKTM